MRRRSELIRFLQKYLGYALTGEVTDQLLPILYGKGANGKSTLVNAILELLGPDYAMKAPPDLLMAKKGQHPTERADLHGKRFVACVEIEENRRLAECLLKELTGGDRIRARRMREDFWEFPPTHKIVLACNHHPEVRGTDHAIWRRLQLVPFDVVIPDEQQDKKLPEKLRAELCGILGWCVQGCLDWQSYGLDAPEEVSSATDEYRRQQDALANFLEECCTVQPDAKARASLLYQTYKCWADENGEEAVSQRRLGESLTERGFERYPSNGIWYRGIGLREDE